MIRSFRLLSFMLGFAAMLSGCGGHASDSPAAATVTPSIPAEPVAANKSVHVQEPPSRPDAADADVPRTYHGPVPILMYHSIHEDPKNPLMVSPPLFAQEMQHLKDAGYHPLNFEDLLEWKKGRPLPAKPIVITFDDGYRDNYTEAYPVLKRLGFKATIFVISGFVGGKNNLTWDEIREMQQSGLIEIGAHTVSHLDLTKLSNEQKWSEIYGSKTAIEQQIGHPVIAFAYPAGRYDEATVKLTEKAGYAFAVTTYHGLASLQQGALTLHRIRIPGNESADAFAREFP
jgi:peptidoglycan/xylan/chitin deacetylase (PgdA/CDA1 family)